MRTDRELLELAAKAAGGEYRDHALGGQYLAFPPNWNGVKWSPLEDDGDALRLLCKLQLSVNSNSATVGVGGYDRSWNHVYVQQAIVGGDSVAAHCRAIVRAAAEIGAAM